MKLLALATVNSRGAPVVGPVDGIFYRGEFWFGTSPIRPSHPAYPPKPGRERDARFGRGIGGHRPRHGAHRGHTGGPAGRVRRSLPRNIRGRLAGMGQGRGCTAASSRGACSRFTWLERTRGEPGCRCQRVWSGTSNPCQREIAPSAVKPLPGISGDKRSRGLIHHLSLP